MTISIQYTTIPDMRNRLGVEAQHLAYALSIGATGTILGGLLAPLADRSDSKAQSDDFTKRQYRTKLTATNRSRVRF